MRSVVRVLLAVNAVFWLGVSMLVFTGVVDLGIASSSSRIVLAALMLGNGIALLFSAWTVLRGRRVIDIAAALLLAANAVLSVTDEVGPLDVFALTVSVTALVLLAVLSARRRMEDESV